MRIKFSQAVHIDGKDYKLGVHELSEKTLAHPHFQKFVQAGWAHEASKEVLPESAFERSKRLADKLAGSSKAPIPPKQSPGAEEPSSEVTVDSAPTAASLEGDAASSIDGEAEASESEDESNSEQKKKQKHKKR